MNSKKCFLSPNISFHILRNIPNLDTLKNAIRINKIFYTIYKENALSLIKRAVLRMCPPAWELREMNIPWMKPGTTEYLRFLAINDIPLPHTTIENYFIHYEYEMYIIARLTAIILIPQQRKKPNAAARDTLLRIRILPQDKTLRYHRDAVIDALYRIWTFCRIFGCGKGREHDWEGQEDWMAGGTHAHRPTGCRVSGHGGNSEVLSLPPASFGWGNGDGLSAYQIETMLYIWNFLWRALRTRVDDDLKRHALVPEADGLIEEWVAYIMTLGLAAVNHLLFSNNPVREAQQLGWAGCLITRSHSSYMTFLVDAGTRRLQRMKLSSRGREGGK